MTNYTHELVSKPDGEMFVLPHYEDAPYTDDCARMEYALDRFREPVEEETPEAPFPVGTSSSAHGSAQSVSNLLFTEWAPSLPCDMAAHAQGRNGCVPEQSGTYEVTDHHTGRHYVVCQGYVIWLRGNLNATFVCTHCHTLMCLGDTITFVGPIGQKENHA